ncbi:pyrroloquinoline quinone biosynthesis peptide chaperone PqqD [Methylophaga nitratireducenticrescens]|uniref:Coenzyme PQQ synthesis protein D n=1 Tax=Methylophaga nitratireducenticrescens TaxID=754476 RepID=I1XFY4_METNJ|nr:pyrroloquinoline quinone biosynthesis peptide chaperone PqqD [Methylophaga nitratireducenticrescens]AFI83303.1 pyrroloquinoline quinone biosynthesis protein PqqD [Methylophaga nitratireducenticrescens]AUZ83427.1 pyrroloquinoline quinone biosynthesis protein PqqD [Methylophaga nitratireducenticrescens]
MVKNITPENIVELAPLYLFRWEEPQQAHILLYPEGVVKLNETGAAIIKHCDGTHTVKEISTLLSDLYTTDVSESVQKFLEVSYAKGWIRIKS